MSAYDQKAIVPALKGADKEVPLDKEYEEDKDVAVTKAYTQTVDLDTAEHLRQVEAMEERLQEGTAADEVSREATDEVAPNGGSNFLTVLSLVDARNTPSTTTTMSLSRFYPRMMTLSFPYSHFESSYSASVSRLSARYSLSFITSVCRFLASLYAFCSSVFSCFSVLLPLRFHNCPPL
jgi:hypothetical protein